MCSTLAAAAGCLVLIVLSITLTFLPADPTCSAADKETGDGAHVVVVVFVVVVVAVVVFIRVIVLVSVRSC